MYFWQWVVSGEQTVQKIHLLAFLKGNIQSVFNTHYGLFPNPQQYFRDTKYNISLLRNCTHVEDDPMAGDATKTERVLIPNV